MKKNIFKSIWIISFIIEIIVLVVFNLIHKNTYESSINTIWGFFLIIEFINLIFGVLIIRKKDNNIVYIIFSIFVIITLFIPIYHKEEKYAPTGPNSYLMGVAYKEKNLNIYGINISGIFN